MVGWVWKGGDVGKVVCDWVSMERVTKRPRVHVSSWNEELGTVTPTRTRGVTRYGNYDRTCVGQGGEALYDGNDLRGGGRS